MVIVLIKWKIRLGREDEFLKYWRQKATIQDRSGLIGEFLSEVRTKHDFSYINWDLAEVDNESYKVYVNVGMWADPTSFQEQVGKYFQDTGTPRGFEAERRVRTLLVPKCRRMGKQLLPKDSSEGVL